ncbi:MAG: hypothetical protein F6K42_36990 [Leptolyngbya sp. SIO1D8]|nr:hypothetical protein [Leptolyngbya sp. SIO1D8]
MFSKDLYRQQEYEKQFKKISRLLLSLISAISAFHKAEQEADILVSWNRSKAPENHILKTALLNSMTINYSKPFLQGMGKNNTVLMSHKFLTKNTNFNSSLHIALLETSGTLKL